MAFDFTTHNDAAITITDATLAALHATDLTAACWAHVTENNDNTIAKGLCGASDIWTRGWFLYWRRGDSNLRFVAKFNGVSLDKKSPTGSMDLEPGWHHVAAVLRKGIDLRLFADGELILQTSDTSSGDPVTALDDVFRAGIAIENTYSLDGRMADLGLWNRALADEEVAALAEGRLRVGSISQNLQLWWPMDGPETGAVNSGNIGLIDASGNGRHGSPYLTVNGAAGPPLHWPLHLPIAAPNNVHGGYRVYRGEASRSNIDYATPVAVIDPTAVGADLAGLDHADGSRTFYALRAVSATGKEERNRDVVAALSLDGDGEQYGSSPTSPTHVFAEAIAGAKIRLRWSWTAATGDAMPQNFVIYGDGGEGSIDFATPIDTLACNGGREYEWTSDALADGRAYQFAVRSQASDGREDDAAEIVTAVADAVAPSQLSDLLIERI